MFSRILYSLLLVISINTSNAQDGTFDPSFGGGDGFTLTPIYEEEHGYGNDVIVQPDGSILITGSTISDLYSDSRRVLYIMDHSE